MIQPHPFRLASAISLLALLLCLRPSLQAVEIQVVNNSNGDPGSLRAALIAAGNGDVITFDPIFSGATIALTTGALAITSSVTIDASALDEPIIISGNNLSRVFTVSTGVTATLRSLVIRNGRSASGTAGTPATPGADGGGILHQGTSLTLIDCTLTENSTGGGGSGSSGLGSSGARGGRGGAIFVNGGTLHLINSTLFGNTTGSGGSGDITNFGSGGQGGFGGGIFNSGGTVNLLNSTLHNNLSGDGGFSITGGSGGRGGGIHNEAGTVTIQQSTITANQAGNSGGSSATAGSGGGISDNNGTLVITHSIVAANSSGRSIGISAFGADFSLTGTTLTRNGVSLIGNNETVSTQYPLPAAVGQPNANGDLVGNSTNPFDPELGDLLDVGGRTAVRVPSLGSPVIDRGPVAALPLDEFDLDGDSNTTEALPLDQRGSVRVSGARVDLGATEDTLTAKAAQRASLQAQIRKLTKQAKLAQQRGSVAQAKALLRKLKLLKRQLAAL